MKEKKTLFLYFISDSFGNCAFKKSFELFCSSDSEAATAERHFVTLLDSKEIIHLNNGNADLLKVKILLVEDVFLFKSEEERVFVSFDEVLKLVDENKIHDSFLVAALLQVERKNLLQKEIPVLYQDEYLVAVNKPAGLLVHRSSESSDRTFLLQKVRDQIGERVSPIHRLDRPTSGIVLFGIERESVTKLFRQFREREVKKHYLAVVRGFTDDKAVIDYPLKSMGKSGVVQQAVTEYRTLARTEVPISAGKYLASRYSLVLINLLTGRTHQIRRHFHHISHPLIGDTKYGDGRHNMLFREHFRSYRLMLTAAAIEFIHPVSEKKINLAIRPDESFLHALHSCGLMIPAVDDYRIF